MEYKGYIGSAIYGDDAGIFHGDVVNTRDVITFQGESVAQLRQAFRDSVDDYLSYDFRFIPKTKQKALRVLHAAETVFLSHSRPRLGQNGRLQAPARSE